MSEALWAALRAAPWAAEDEAREECGVMAVYAPDRDAARLSYYGLFALQHRGQESAGIAAFDGKAINTRKSTGLVSQVFSETDMESLSGSLAIGHTRYSTTGSSNLRNAQPFLIDTQHGPVALAHNGNLVNARVIRQALLEKGVGLTSASDTELMVMALAGSEGSNWTERIGSAMRTWKGAFSFVALTPQGVFAARDPWGFRPLACGFNAEGAFVAASETCALLTLGCTGIREIGPGQIISCSTSGEVSWSDPLRAEGGKRASCVFEFIYFSRPDSVWNGQSVSEVRRRFGEELAKRSPAEADLVIPVPDSSISAAIGFARASGIPYGEAFVKNRYIGRTFIEPTTFLRKRGVSLKYNVLGQSVSGKRIVVVDDSIVRGNTIRPLVALLRGAGAREVHVRVASPPVRFPCMMGVDMGEPGDLVANLVPLKDMAAWSGADSLAYLSLESAGRALGGLDDYCAACFSGDYPLELDASGSKERFEF
ncbi:MAG: amidophosphoribosyltransferase [Spirochaetes bacterium]|nr:amidophosphoribosyltransferase [Spirochaetota bacterium]